MSRDVSPPPQICTQLDRSDWANHAQISRKKPLPCHDRGDATRRRGCVRVCDANGRYDGQVDGDVNLKVDIGEELIERIAERAAELVARQRDETAGDGWLRGASKIAAYIDAPRSRVYGLVSARRIPVHHDGSALLARRSELDAWLLNGGGRRP